MPNESSNNPPGTGVQPADPGTANAPYRPDPADYTPEARQARQDAVNKYMTEVQALLKLSRGAAKRVSRRTAPFILAPILTQLVRAGSDLLRSVQACADRTGLKPEQILAEEERVRELSTSKQTLDTAAAAVSNELTGAKEAIYEHMKQLLGWIRDTLESSWVPQDIRDQVQEASQEILGLVQRQLRALQGKRKDTVASKAEGESTDEEVAWLEMSNKYLSGKELRPGDMAPPPPKKPPKAKATKAKPRTTKGTGRKSSTRRTKAKPTP